MARTKTYKDCRAINGVLGTPNLWFQPFRDVLWQHHCFENILKYKCLNWGGKYMVVPYLGDMEGNFWKDNCQSLTEFLHLGISWRTGFGYLEMESVMTWNQQAQILDIPLPLTNRRLSSRLLWNLGFNFYLRKLGLIPLSSFFQVVCDQPWDLHTLLHLQHRSPVNGLSVSTVCYLSSWVICSQVLV